MSRQTTVDSLLLSVAAGQPSDSIAMVCSPMNPHFEKKVAKSTIAFCMLNIGFHWKMSQRQSPTYHRC